MIDTLSESEIISRLHNDNHYYGEFGRKFLSNSDIKTLMSNPLNFGGASEKTVNMVVGSYLHTIVLQPDKVDTFKILDYANRNYKGYKDEVATDREICLLQHEADSIMFMRDQLMSNRIVRDLIHGSYEEANVQHEVPGIKPIMGNTWKGKADVINHDERLVIDLKTTSNIDKFKWSVRDYNYDSQAYLYREIFGYDLIFIVIDKNTHKINIFEVSDETLLNGEKKVFDANAIYDLYFKTEGFEPTEYVETKII